MTFLARAGGSGVLVAVGDDDLFAGFVPVAAVVDAGEGADGADDGVGGGDDALGLLDEEAEGVSRFFGAEAEEAEGVAVPVDDAAVAEIEFVGDDGRTVPVKDGLVDCLSFGVIADGAVGYVAVEAAVGLLVGATDPPGPVIFEMDFKKVSLALRDGSSLAYWFGLGRGFGRVSLFRIESYISRHLDIVSFEFYWGAGLTLYGRARSATWVWCGERRRGRGAFVTGARWKRDWPVASGSLG